MGHSGDNDDREPAQSIRLCHAICRCQSINSFLAMGHLSAWLQSADGCIPVSHPFPSWSGMSIFRYFPIPMPKVEPTGAWNVSVQCLRSQKVGSEDRTIFHLPHHPVDRKTVLHKPENSCLLKLQNKSFSPFPCQLCHRVPLPSNTSRNWQNWHSFRAVPSVTTVVNRNASKCKHDPNKRKCWWNIWNGSKCSDNAL